MSLTFFQKALKTLKKANKERRLVQAGAVGAINVNGATK